MFDLLTRPGPDLNSDERDEVKKVARHLYQQKCAAIFEHVFKSFADGHKVATA